MRTVRHIPESSQPFVREASFADPVLWSPPAGERLIAYSLMSLIALTALAFGTVEPWSIALFGLLVLAIFICWGLRLAVFRPIFQRPVFPVILLPLLTLGLCGLVQTIPLPDASGRHWTLSMDPEATRLAIEPIVILLLAGLLVANVFNSYRALRGLLSFIVIFGFLFSIFALINHFTWNNRFFWVVEPSTPPAFPFGSFVNRNHFAGYVGMIAPIPAGLVLRRVVRGPAALFHVFAAVVICLAMLTSLSRGGVISLVCGALFVVLLGMRPASRHSAERSTAGRPLLVPRLLAALLIPAAIFAGIVWVGADSVAERINSSSGAAGELNFSGNESAFYKSRGFIWEDTIRMIGDNPLLGVGIGAFQTAYPIYSRRDRLHLVGQAHNDYLQALADGGIIAGSLVVLFIGLLLISLRKALGHPDPFASGLAVGCAGGVFAMLVHSLFDFNLQLISNSFLFLTLSIVIWRVGYEAGHLPRLGSHEQ